MVEKNQAAFLTVISMLHEAAQCYTVSAAPRRGAGINAFTSGAGLRSSPACIVIAGKGKNQPGRRPSKYAFNRAVESLYCVTWGFAVRGFFLGGCF